VAGAGVVADVAPVVAVTEPESAVAVPPAAAVGVVGGCVGRTVTWWTVVVDVAGAVAAGVALGATAALVAVGTTVVVVAIVAVAVPPGAGDAACEA
jgi:hypothetical protein